MSHHETCGICHTSGPCPHHTSAALHSFAIIGPGLVLPPDPKDLQIESLRAHAARLEGEVERLTTALKAGALTTAVCGKCGGQWVDALVVGMERARADAAESRAARLEERLGVVAAALDGVWCAMSSNGRKCWCAYEQILHPQNDPQDALALEPNGHTKECNVAERALAAALVESPAHGPCAP